MAIIYFTFIYSKVGSLLETNIERTDPSSNAKPRVGSLQQPFKNCATSVSHTVSSGRNGSSSHVASGGPASRERGGGGIRPQSNAPMAGKVKTSA